MRSVDTKMLIGYQVHEEVYETAKLVKKELKEEFNRDILIQTVKEFNKYKLNEKFASYLKSNLHLVIETLKELDIEVDLKVFDDVELFGRCQKKLCRILQ